MKPTVIKLTESTQPIRVLSTPFIQLLDDDGSHDLFADKALEGLDDETISNFTDEEINQLVDEVSSNFDADEDAEFESQESYFDALDSEQESNFDDDEFSYARGQRAKKRLAKKQARIAKRQDKKQARRSKRIEKIKAKRANARERVKARMERKKEKVGKRIDKKEIRKSGKVERKEMRKSSKAKRKGLSEETPDGEMTDGADINDAGSFERDSTPTFENTKRNNLNVRAGKKEVIDTPSAEVIEPSETEEGKFEIFDLIGHLIK